MRHLQKAIRSSFKQFSTYEVVDTPNSPARILRQFGIVNPFIQANLSVPEFY